MHFSRNSSRRFALPSPSMAVALIALSSSLGGAGYAATTLTTAGARPLSATAVASTVTARGPRGPRGFRGARGITGPRGAVGSQGPQGAPGAPAVLNRTRLDFKPRHYNISVSSAYEQVESIGTVNKLQADTVLRVAVNDTVGADGVQHGAVGCALQLRLRAPYIDGGGFCYEGGGADATPVPHTAIVEEMQ